MQLLLLLHDQGVKLGLRLANLRRPLLYIRTLLLYRLLLLVDHRHFAIQVDLALIYPLLEVGKFLAPILGCGLKALLRLDDLVFRMDLGLALDRVDFLLSVQQELRSGGLRVTRAVMREHKMDHEAENQATD